MEGGGENTQRIDAYMQQLARQLNSSQSFSPGDAFSLDVTTIRMPEEGGKPKKYDPVKAKVRGILKRSRIPITNDDNLCCARAVVTMRAWADEQAGQFPTHAYSSLRRGIPCQKNPSPPTHGIGGIVPFETVWSARTEKDSRGVDARISNQSHENWTSSHDCVCRTRGTPAHSPRLGRRTF